MKFYQTNDFFADSPSVVALGCFDGVHIGHAAVIREAVLGAKLMGVKSAVWCFEEPPRNFFAKNSTPVLTAPDQKRALIESLGVDILVCVRFDTEIGSLSPSDFFEEIIIKRMRAAGVVCGFNYSFGKGGSGNTELLSELCKKNGIGFTCLPPVLLDGTAVSSSAIRTAISDGDMKKATVLLGRHYSITSTVIDGNHIGRKLGFPTANISLDGAALTLKRGVYVTRTSFDGKSYFGITNVGTHPTVSPDDILAETNLFDFSGDLYTKTIKLEFIDFLREERKFPSLDDLSTQVRCDIEKARTFIYENYLSK